MLIRWLRVLVPGLLLCAIGAYRIAFPATAGAESHLSELPRVLLGLKGEDVPLEQTVLDDLDPDDIVIRRYWRPDGVPVWVVVIYFANRRLGGHDPQLCYRSQGFGVASLPDSRVETPGGVVRAEGFLASRAGRNERVATFWYAPGRTVVPDVGGYRGRLFLQGLRQNRTYGAFVRISTLETDHPGEAQRWNERFVGEVARLLPALIRE